MYQAEKNLLAPSNDSSPSSPNKLDDSPGPVGSGPRQSIGHFTFGAFSFWRDSLASGLPPPTLSGRNLYLYLKGMQG